MAAKVGIVMANYEMPPPLVRQAILSVVAQNMPDWHLYLVGVHGDESTASLEDEVTVDERVSVIYADKPQVYQQRNIGLIQAIEDGVKYTTFLDSDDFMLPCKLFMEVKMAEIDNLDLVYTSFYYTDAILRIFKYQQVPRTATKHKILESCWLPDYTMVDARFMKAHLGAQEDDWEGYLNWPRYSTGCVYDMWIRAVENDARFGMHPVPTWLYRQRENSLGKQLNATELLDREQVIKDAKKRWGVNTETVLGLKTLWEPGDGATYE